MMNNDQKMMVRMYAIFCASVLILVVLAVFCSSCEFKARVEHGPTVSSKPIVLNDTPNVGERVHATPSEVIPWSQGAYLFVQHTAQQYYLVRKRGSFERIYRVYRNSMYVYDHSHMDKFDTLWVPHPVILDKNYSHYNFRKGEEINMTLDPDYLALIRPKRGEK